MLAIAVAVSKTVLLGTLMKPWSLEFFVPGKPIAQPRPRLLYSQGKQHFGVPSSHAVHGYRDSVALLSRLACRDCPGVFPTSEPLAVLVYFTLGKPGKEKSWHISRPDSDNLYKSTIDAMKDIVFFDDAQIAMMTAIKTHCGPQEKVGVRISVRPLGLVDNEVASQLLKPVLL